MKLRQPWSPNRPEKSTVILAPGSLVTIAFLESGSHFPDRYWIAGSVSSMNTKRCGMVVAVSALGCIRTWSTQNVVPSRMVTLRVKMWFPSGTLGERQSGQLLMTEIQGSSGLNDLPSSTHSQVGSHPRAVFIAALEPITRILDPIRPHC